MPKQILVRSMMDPLASDRMLCLMQHVPRNSLPKSIGTSDVQRVTKHGLARLELGNKIVLAQ